MTANRKPLRIKLDSSALRALAYDPETEQLDITFTSGRTYAYAAVPLKLVQGLVRAESAGKFFNAKIKGAYEAHEVA